MSDLTKKQPHRGVDCKVRLTTESGGDMSDLIYVEKVSFKPVLENLESNPITSANTVRHTFLNGWDVELSGIKKSNDLIKFLRDQAKRQSSGKAMEKMAVRLTYKDPDTGVDEVCKLVNATFADINAIESGGGKEKTGQGIKLHAERME
jgi:hypothetical protein